MTALLEAAVARRAAPGSALAEDAERIARACRDMAVRFHHGARLLSFGAGAAAADAGHLAVEFTHPVLVGRPALPAISLADDAAALTGAAQAGGHAAAFAARLRLLGRPGDIAVGVLTDDRFGAAAEALTTARELGMLTVALALPEGCPVAVDHLLPARTADPLIARELHVTIYHVLWELVHVFLEQPAVLATLDGKTTPGEGSTPGGTAAPDGRAAPDGTATPVVPGEIALNEATTPGGTATLDGEAVR